MVYEQQYGIADVLIEFSLFLIHFYSSIPSHEGRKEEKVNKETLWLCDGGDSGVLQ